MATHTHRYESSGQDEPCSDETPGEYHALGFIDGELMQTTKHDHYGEAEAMVDGWQYFIGDATFHQAAPGCCN
jgi:hypothetical protein